MARRTAKEHWIRGAVIPENELPKKRVFVPRKDRPCGYCGKVLSAKTMKFLRNIFLQVGPGTKKLEGLRVPLCKECSELLGVKIS